MEIKFTPWRMAYIRGIEPTASCDCVLCNLFCANTTSDPENLVLYRGTSCYVVLNLYPYNTGHLMVVPYCHTADLVGLDEECAQELFALVRRCIAHLREIYQPHGFNLGMNLGRVAGAGIDEHLHMHIVPRWSGDINFLPLLGGTKLIPESLEQTYLRLQPFFAEG